MTTETIDLNPADLYPAIAGWATDGNELLVGGVALSRLAERVGTTPFFAYDRARLTARIDLLRRHLAEAVSLNYAIKANPMPAVVQHLAGLVDGFDVASAGEMQTALDTPMAAARVSFAGPGKTDPELRRAVAAGVLVELESEGEMRRLARLGE
ncbi:MAG TPA: pyridoxal-dependent decarboxylase, exosortase A system-associated, partial [Alphaproteobacteria bacterium]|nr:pyridoxal-dependent decarboxylase, exosortase A system-associated [Alphaproteobacteria bacterium]